MDKEIFGWHIIRTDSGTPTQNIGFHLQELASADLCIY